MLYNKLSIDAFHSNHKVVSAILIIRSNENVFSEEKSSFQQIAIDLTPFLKLFEREPNINRTIKEFILDNLL